jgi:protein-S-isoprenylcysteine O-methyltransferase Ste14
MVGIARGIITVLWLVFVAYWLISSRDTKATVGRRGTGSALRILAPIAILIGVRGSALGPSPVHESAAVGDVLDAIGVACAAVGVGVAIWARHQLGRNWGMPGSVKEAPELITSGPYRYVRHPIYTGVLVAMLGSALSQGRVYLFMFVAFGIYFVYSARNEEQTMAEEFPAQYERYRHDTKMLVPYLL